MSDGPFRIEPIPGASFGARARAPGTADAAGVVALAEAQPEVLPAALDAALGLLVLPGLDAVREAPQLLLRLSRLFGREVEDYRETGMERHMIHPRVPQILVVSNAAPVNRAPPPPPDPPRDAHGGLPLRFPHRRGWHSDQSYRRPPPDVSLFHAVAPAPPGQGQTLYASGVLAYEALPQTLRRRAEGLVGIHAKPGSGRSEQAVRAGEAPRPLPATLRPQRQPVVRVHPVTGRRALYLCEGGQMDWVDGPFAGLEPGVDGAGAQLLYELMAHYTRPEFVYVHEWRAGDLVVYDNRALIHCATWFDATVCERVMWRTTVSGNPGPEYAGEARSWAA